MEIFFRNFDLKQKAMKKRIAIYAFVLSSFYMPAQLGNVGGILKNKLESAVSKKKENSDTTKAKPAANSQDPATTAGVTQPSPAATAAATTPRLKAYQNYDFIPGDKIIFEDDFRDDQDGEFAAHWKLNSGQAVVNTVQGHASMLLTDGNYAEVYPRMKTENYLGDNFTVEFDFIFMAGADGAFGYQPIARFYYPAEGGYETSFEVQFQMGEVAVGDLHKSYSPTLNEGFENKWHHAAIVLKNGQMKTYVDQYRVCVNPNVDMKFNRIAFVGIGSETNPIVFTNVRIAEGGGMNLIGKKFTDSKIVTHGITFDVNKATIKPESMGTLNMIVKVMTENPELKFEIDGHTDADGDDATNMKLSQARADAVKTQLVTMGINTDRLTTKGFGESKPVSDNTTPEGKASNRRVEFVKQ